MIRYIFLVFIILSLVSCGGGSQQNIAENSKNVFSNVTIQKDGSISKRCLKSKYVPGEILVKFKAGASKSLVHTLHDSLGAQKIREIKHIGVQHIKLPHNVNIEEAIKYYKADPNVEYDEPNYIVRRAAIPNDPGFINLIIQDKQEELLTPI